MRTAVFSILILALSETAFADLTVTFDATGRTYGDVHFGLLYGINVEGDQDEFVEAFEMELLDSSNYAWAFGFSSDLDNNLGQVITRIEFADVLAARGHPYREIMVPWTTNGGDAADFVELNLLPPGIPAGREVRFDLEDGGSLLKGGDFAGLLKVTATSNLGYTDSAVLEIVSAEQSIAVLNLAPPIPEPSSWLLAILLFSSTGYLLKKYPQSA